jgi:hypothetical protein
MSQKPKVAAVPEETPSREKKLKTCFVIMPIADMDGYEPGHFSRVYEYLIKPACANAGYEAHRADFVAATNYIIIDILRKIIDSDLVICDLSGRNPNVLYELGVRQAFNLPTVLIKDSKTQKIFDIQGLRYTEYNDALRIDEVQKECIRLQTSITETAESPHDVNSMIQLLGVKPAQLPNKLELSNETSVILESLKDISTRISSIESMKQSKTTTSIDLRESNTNSRRTTEMHVVNGEPFKIGDILYIDGKKIGTLEAINPIHIIIRTPDETLAIFGTGGAEAKKLTRVPF